MSDQILRKGMGWIAMWILLSGVLGASEPLPLPLDLKWADTPAKLVGLADQFGFDKTVKAPGKNPRITILEVGPEKGTLPGHDASSVAGRFIDGRLYEVAVHYTYPGQKADFVKAKFIELKKGLALRHGKFQFNGEKKTVADGITTSSGSYHVKLPEGRMLLLAVTEVRDDKRGDSAARFSVIYHNRVILHGK